MNNWRIDLFRKRIRPPHGSSFATRKEPANHAKGRESEALGMAITRPIIDLRPMDESQSSHATCDPGLFADFRVIRGHRLVRVGSMLLEIGVSAALLGTLLVIINQSLVALKRQHRLADRRFVAQEVLENQLAAATQLSYATLTAEKLDALRLSEFATAKLPHAELQAELSQETEPVAAKRITLRLSWQDQPDQTQKPLTLTAWVFPPLEAHE